MKNIHYSILLCLWRLVTAEVTLTNLESFLRTQRLTIMKMESYVKKERDRIDIVKRLLNRHKTEDSIAREIPQYVENPYRAFPLVRRLTTDLNFVHKMARQTTEFVINTELAYPLYSDLEGAINTILRLQETYNLNVSDIANGRLVYKSTPLNVDDCYTIAAIAYQRNRLHMGVEWMVMALVKYYSAPERYDHTEVKLVDYIALGYRLLNDTRNALFWTQRLVELKPNDPRVPQQIKYIDECQKKLNWEEFQQKYGEPVLEAEKEKSSPILAKYCAKQMLHKTMEITDRYNLKCYYTSVTHPYLTLSPVKLELLHPRPVVMFHDVITDAEINHIIGLSTKRLRSTSSKISPEYRYSSVAYIPQNESVIVSRINQRIADYTTGVQSEQPMRVIRYGISGYYQPFVNKSQDINTSPGEETPTVTAMFYLSDIQGGATVFPFLGLSVLPVKGAALVYADVDMAATMNPEKYLVKPAKVAAETAKDAVYPAINIVKTAKEDMYPAINIVKTAKKEEYSATNIVNTANEGYPAINKAKTAKEDANPIINTVKTKEEAVNPAMHIVCPVLHGFSWVAVNSVPWYHHSQTTLHRK